MKIKRVKTYNVLRTEFKDAKYVHCLAKCLVNVSFKILLPFVLWSQ